jgi:NADPH-dependent curcumin reductase CurA
MLVRRLKMQGFIVSEFLSDWPAALGELVTLASTGKLKWRETIADGVEKAPSAFLGMLKGKNFGKQLVKLF